ncbi:MAG: GH92 family glycosyl hydrolase [Ktedonobacteraceae bacterium]|nr:GH92 family glycosyl hydrolase [Ktedonobacteraceae bacterium]
MKRQRFFLVASLITLTLTIFAFSPGHATARVATVTSPALVSDPASVVNPFVQTDNGGNDFPGADMPFGMVQWSPDTNNRSAGGNYSYGDNRIRGYALTHIAGPGCGAMGDDPILPMTGNAPSNVNGTMASYSHTGEMANAGYYTATTGSPAIKTELTVTQRSGMARFTYPATTSADILIKLRDSQNQNNTDPSSAQIVSNTEVIGNTTSGHFCGDVATYTVHFDMVFDHPFTASRILGSGGAGPTGIFLTFNTTTTQVLQAKIGVSFVSNANAKLNWQTENPNWNFDTIHTAAHNAWNNLLNKIGIAGGTSSQQQLFYSELYHALLHPNVVSDTNGQFMGYDHKVHTLASGQQAHYENYSGWDIEHAQAALSALVAPQQTSDMAQSLIQAYDEMGEIPQWGFMNSRTGVMIGDSADIEIAHYYAFGARSFNTQAALTDLLHQASTSNDMRLNTSTENQYGYFPDNPGSTSWNPSLLIEYCQDDFALSRLALALGDTADATRLAQRANNWKNIFDPSTKLLSPRQANGTFIHVSASNSDFYTEGTAAQYRFQVPFNQPAEAAMMGGNAATNSTLDSFFQSFDGSNPTQSFLANEFDLGQPWFYDWTGEPSHTQEVVHRMLNTLYGDNSNTFPNNDDLGTMSSQYVWGMMGFYPVTPGSADVAIDSPEFTNVVIHLGNGNTITINAPQANGSNYYVQSLNVNGSPSTHTWLPASIFSNGATLDFTLGSSPSSWGTSPNDAPPSYDNGTGGNGGAQPLSALVNNTGISDDSNQGAANFDNDGYSYSQQALTGAGLKPGAQVTVNGLNYTWPNASSGQQDNVQASGQQVSVNAAKGASRLGFLGSAANGNASGTATITYTDGSTQSFTLGMTDWAQSAAFGNRVAATMSYRNSTGGSSQSLAIYVFEAEVTLQSGKQVATVTLPGTVSGGQLHVFAISAG